jgi:hypothetical protein
VRWKAHRRNVHEARAYRSQNPSLPPLPHRMITGRRRAMENRLRRIAAAGDPWPRACWSPCRRNIRPSASPGELGCTAPTPTYARARNG